MESNAHLNLEFSNCCVPSPAANSLVVIVGARSIVYLIMSDPKTSRHIGMSKDSLPEELSIDGIGLAGSSNLQQHKTSYLAKQLHGKMASRLSTYKIDA